jgi:hypothetical protein
MSGNRNTFGDRVQTPNITTCIELYRNMWNGYRENYSIVQSQTRNIKQLCEKRLESFSEVIFIYQ